METERIALSQSERDRVACYREPILGVLRLTAKSCCAGHSATRRAKSYRN